MEQKKDAVVLIGNHHIVIYNFRKEFIQRLIQKGYRVVVFMPYTKEAEKIKALGCEIIDIYVDRRGMNPLKDLKLYREYKKRLRELRPKMVFTYTIKPNIYGGLACKKLKIPYVCTITGLGKAIEQGGVTRTFVMTLYKMALIKVQKVFFQNEDNQKLFAQKNIGDGRYGMVKGSGVNLETFACHPFPTEDTPIIFLFVARISKTKGIETFLEAAQYIKGKYPTVEFHILGFWEEDYKQLVSRYIQDGIVCYHGLQENVIPYLEKCQCLLHPSQFEGMSNACLEAAAVGRAIIASDIPGCRECVEDGKTGYLHKVDDVKSLTEKIEKFIALPYNERKQMGELGRRKMEQEFSREYVVDSYMAELEN